VEVCGYVRGFEEIREFQKMNVIQLVWKHPCEGGTRLERFVGPELGPSAMLAAFVGLGTRVVVAAPFYQVLPGTNNIESQVAAA